MDENKLGQLSTCNFLLGFNEIHSEWNKNSFLLIINPICLNIYILRRKAQKLTGEEAAALGSVQYVDKARGIAVVLEGEGGDLKGKQ